MRSSMFWDVTQLRLVTYRRFGTTYRSHIQAAHEEFFLNCLMFEMRPMGCPTMSVT